jgi:hypothetical protein
VSLEAPLKSTHLTVRNAPPGAKALLTWTAPSGRVDTTLLPITGPTPWSTLVVGTFPSGTTLRIDLLTADGAVVTTLYGPPIP